MLLNYIKNEELSGVTTEGGMALTWTIQKRFLNRYITYMHTYELYFCGEEFILIAINWYIICIHNSSMAVDYIIILLDLRALPFVNVN